MRFLLGIKSRQSYFIDQNGTHTRGFMPFFGPTVHTSIQKVAAFVTGASDKRQRKKLTSHYHLVKKEKLTE